MADSGVEMDTLDTSKSNDVVIFDDQSTLGEF